MLLHDCNNNRTVWQVGNMAQRACSQVLAVFCEGRDKHLHSELIRLPRDQSKEMLD